MKELLKELCLTDGVSGDESAVRELIISKIKDVCEYRTDNLGNLICFKKGRKTPAKKLMVCAHMDEVGMMVTEILENGFKIFTGLKSTRTNDTRILSDVYLSIFLANDSIKSLSSLIFLLIISPSLL